MQTHFTNCQTSRPAGPPIIALLIHCFFSNLRHHSGRIKRQNGRKKRFPRQSKTLRVRVCCVSRCPAAYEHSGSGHFPCATGCSENYAPTRSSETREWRIVCALVVPKNLNVSHAKRWTATSSQPAPVTCFILLGWLVCWIASTVEQLRIVGLSSFPVRLCVMCVFAFVRVCVCVWFQKFRTVRTVRPEPFRGG